MSEHDAGAGAFASSRQCFEAVLGFLDGEEACGFEHGELEEHLEQQSRELFRRLFQDHLVPWRLSKDDIRPAVAVAGLSQGLRVLRTRGPPQLRRSMMRTSAACDTQCLGSLRRSRCRS
jgi:hypothetical protein